MKAIGKSIKSVYRHVGPLILMVIIMLIMLVIFSVNSRKSANAVIEESLLEVVDKCAEKLQREVEGMIAVARPTVTHMEYDGKYSEQEIQEICTILESQSGANRVLICSKDGEGYWSTAEVYKAENVPQLDRIFSQSNEYTFRMELEEGDCYLVSSIPFYRNEVSWRVVMFYNLDNLGQLVRTELSDANGFVALTDQNGRIIASGGSESVFTESENLFDCCDDQNNKDVACFKTRMKSRSAAVSRASSGKEEVVLAMMPYIDGELDMIVGFPAKYVNRKLASFNKNARDILWELVAVMLVFMGIFIGKDIRNQVHHSESARSLREEADTDLLTGMYNKLATERKIKEYIEAHPDEQCMMVLLDLDNFKKINDTMGHAFGDEVLRTLGNDISSIFRVSDIMGRIGGDEFMVFIKGMNSSQDIKKQVDKITGFFRNFRAGDYVKYSSTASIGVSVFSRDGKTFEELYKAADKALYESKRNGKNQLTFFNDSFLTEE